MTIENDPPVTDQKDLDATVDFDDTSSIESDFDDVSSKKSSPIVKFGGMAVVLMLLGGGGYYYWANQSQPAPYQSINAAVNTASDTAEAGLKALSNDQLIGAEEQALIDGLPPQPTNTAMDAGVPEMSDVMTPFADENIVIDSQMDAADQMDVTELSDETTGMAMAGVEGADDSMEMQTDDVMPDIAMVDTINAEPMGVDASTMDDVDVVGDVEMSADMDTTKDMSTDDLDIANDVDTGAVDAPLQPFETVVPETEVEFIGQPGISPEQTAIESGTAPSVDEQLQKELIESLMQAPSPTATPNVANNVQVTVPTQGTPSQLYSGTSAATAGAANTQRNNANALREIETPAMVRPQPKKFYVLERNSAPAARDTKLVDAKRALKRGQNERALQLFDRLSSNDTSVMLGRGVALQRLARYDEALTTYENVLRSDPENLEALTNVLGILSLQNPAYSLEKLDRLQAKYPSNVGILVQLGLAKADAGKLAEAVEHLSYAQRLDGENAAVAYNLGVMYDRSGNKVDAANNYRRALLLVREGRSNARVPISAIKTRLSTIQ